MYVNVKEAKEPLSFKVVAHCCYCGDKSFEQTFEGLMSTAPVFGSNEIVNIVPKGDATHFYTKKLERLSA